MSDADERCPFVPPPWFSSVVAIGPYMECFACGRMKKEHEGLPGFAGTETKP
jgi:hypothetical protein